MAIFGNNPLTGGLGNLSIDPSAYQNQLTAAGSAIDLEHQLREQYRRYSISMARWGQLEDEHVRMSMLHMRMRTEEGGRLPFDHVSTGLSGEKVFVMVCNRGSAVVLEDERDLFPSDALITQMRLLA